MTRKQPQTHTAPHFNATHNGPFESCTQYPCAPSRQATAFLRENDPLTPIEKIAWAAIQERRWILWHANDIARGVLTVLSRAGLLRDTQHEQQQAQADTYWAGIAQQNRRADARAITNLNQLANQAADRLNAGDNPQVVAAWLRTTQEAISKQRDTERAATALDAASHETTAAAA
ncbi:hypothetical protein [Streptomyces sp. NPDC020983]|uniref:hypothetical protein n=1 Tax=Streptomyces sp. NPDC020983 TaxID=3365106 RepID=UPI00379837E3